MMCVSGCGSEVLRFEREHPARGSESLKSGQLASEMPLGDSGKEGPGKQQSWTYTLENVVHGAGQVRTLHRKSVQVLKGVPGMMWSHQQVRDLGQNPGEGGISDMSKKRRE